MQLELEHPALSVQAAQHTDIGGRDRNEDAAYVDPDGLYFLVADGMGGHAAGEVASAMALDVVRARLDAARPHLHAHAASPTPAGVEMVSALLEAAVRQAHQAVAERAQRELDKHGMGTTLEVVVVAGSDVFIAHVGDSRTYMVRDGMASQVTRDHTMAQVMASTGSMSMQAARSAPMGTVLLNALGVGNHITVDVVRRELRAGDRLLLCTDGLHEYFSGDELAEHMAAGTAEQAVHNLVGLARLRGGHDNITGVVIEAGPDRRHPNTVPRPMPPRPPAIPPPLRRVPSAPPVSRELWDDEPTTPRLARGSSPGPLAEVSEEALSAIVDYCIHEESAPITLVRAAAGAR